MTSRSIRADKDHFDEIVIDAMRTWEVKAREEAPALMRLFGMTRGAPGGSTPCPPLREWTSPTTRPEQRVCPAQATATGPDDWQDAVLRALCHWVIDHLPPQAQTELLPTLLEMFDFYWQQSDIHRLPAAPKAFGRTTRTTRPDVVLLDGWNAEE